MAIKQIEDKYLIVKNMDFRTAMGVMCAGGVVTRESTLIRSGAGCGIDISCLAWLKEPDLLAHDWCVVDKERFHSDRIVG